MILAVQPDFQYGTRHYLKTAHYALHLPAAFLANQKEGEGHSGVNFYQDKIRELTNDGMRSEAAQMYSFVLTRAMSVNNSIYKTRSPSYCSQFRDALNKMIDEYCYLINPLS
jgi:hypothetical protein